MHIPTITRAQLARHMILMNAFVNGQLSLMRAYMELKITKNRQEKLTILMKTILLSKIFKSLKLVFITSLQLEIKRNSFVF